jgi:hypothetical protein
MIGRSRGVVAALLVGAIYTALGVAASAVGGASASGRLGLLARWATFALSGIAFLAHAVHEARAKGAGVTRTGLRSALAAAIGGLGLAVAANLHELTSRAAFRPRMLVALVAWPLLTAIPAFLGAVLLAALFGRRPGRPRDPG